MSVSQIIIMILIGLFTGIVTGLTGASGVMVVVPCLTILSNFSIHEAIGTSLMINIITAAAISYVYYKHGNIELKAGIWIAVGSILGSQVGSFFAAGIKSMGLGIAFAIFMIVMGILIWWKGINSQAIAEQTRGIFKLQTSKQKIFASLGLGLFVGIMTGIFGAGGGGMILIILIFVLNFPLHLAIGTSAFLMTITACSGTIGYALQGNVRLIPALIIGLSSVVSGIAGARFANRVNEQILGKVVGVIFVLLGIIMTILNLK